MGPCFSKKNPNHLASYDPMNVVSNEDDEITYSSPINMAALEEARTAAKRDSTTIYSPSSSSILRFIKKRRADRYYSRNY